MTPGKFFGTFTPEQRQANLAKARASRAEKNADRLASTLRHDFKDAPHWDELAQVKGVRLPPWGSAPTPTVMEKFLRKCGTTTAAYYRWSGEHSLATFAKANPTWPARAWAGIVLEWLAA